MEQPLHLCDSEHSLLVFRRLLKTHLFRWRQRRPVTVAFWAPYKFPFTSHYHHYHPAGWLPRSPSDPISLTYKNRTTFTFILPGQLSEVETPGECPTAQTLTFKAAESYDQWPAVNQWMDAARKSVYRRVVGQHRRRRITVFQFIAIATAIFVAADVWEMGDDREVQPRDNKRLNGAGGGGTGRAIHRLNRRRGWAGQCSLSLSEIEIALRRRARVTGAVRRGRMWNTALNLVDLINGTGTGSRRARPGRRQWRRPTQRSAIISANLWLGHTSSDRVNADTDAAYRGILWVQWRNRKWGRGGAGSGKVERWSPPSYADKYFSFWP